MNKWYQSNADNSDVVLFSKIRLARNIADAPFPGRMSNDIRKSISKKIYATVKSSQLANEFDLVNLSEKSKADAAAYFEKHLISREFAANRESHAFLKSKNDDISIMLCEEDHIRICAFAGGQNLEKAYEKADCVDNIFIENLHIAFSERLGFLTASPINLGTGLKASLVLHLPALANQGSIYRLSSMVAKLGLSLRELYTDGAGDIYVLSNQVSLGISEKSAIDNLNAICTQIVKQERSAREELKENSDYEDKIYRTLGIMKSARKLDYGEFLNFLSQIRLGISLGYFDIDYETIGDLLYTMGDASLVSSAQAELTKNMCCVLRAKLVREKLEK